jgi:hypothetical protein
MRIYDSHCHLFNGRILQDMVPSLMSNVIEKGKPEREPILKGWRDYVGEMIELFVNSHATNNTFLTKSTLDNFPEATDCATVPLMMDVHYLFGDRMNAGDPPIDGTYDISNLKIQINGLRSLSKKGKCYPFFAVDPRRAGIIEAILRGKFVTKKPGDFYGIKLYPRLGYHPMSGLLPSLYKYCADNKIPITTHCSTTGFPTWHTKSWDFCNPENFRPALKANPSLKIDFAHFGYSSPDWSNSIINLMGEFDNVYSDLSCYTNKKELESFKNSYWNIGKVNQRTMYGSDYDVFYFTDAGVDMNDYISNFKTVFTKDELNTMMSVLPEKFLF